VEWLEPFDPLRLGERVPRLIPLVDLAAASPGIVETVFAIPGVGRLTVDAILRRDYPVIQGVVLLFSFVYVVVNLLIDLLYTVLDPRIRY
jgi:ABC-type dipeptide/oligopeptide/nickel transport system permease component